MSAKAVTALYNDAFAPVKVHIIPGLLEKIAGLALEGYAAASHGGLEIGGLLFGRRSSGFVTVEDFRPLACDHSLGPRFILSDRDERGLRDLLGAPSLDPPLRDLFAVGWYCSHTRSDLLLLDRELALHDTYFACANDFVIIMKPRDLRSVTAGIFLRSTDGTVNPHCPASILEIPKPDLTRKPARTATSDPCDLSAFSQSASPSINGRPLPSPNRSRAIVCAASDQPIGQPATGVASAAKPNQKAGKSVKLRVLFAAAGTLALLSLGAWQYLQVPQVHAADLFLNVRPHAGKLLLSWKSNLVKPQRAHVDILDGISSEHLDITEIFQPSGVLLFTHNAGNVEAVFTVETGNGVVVRHASFADPPSVLKGPVPLEKSTGFLPSGISPPGMNPATQQLASKVTATKHPRRRYSRRTRHKKVIVSSTPLQAGEKVTSGHR